MSPLLTLCALSAFSQFAFQHKLISEAELKVANGMYDACAALIDAHTFIVALEECQVNAVIATQCHDWNHSLDTNLAIKKDCTHPFMSLLAH